MMYVKMGEVNLLMERIIYKEVEEIFQFAREKTCNHLTLQRLYNELVRSHERLGQPMRVAIVGRVNTGKSTLMNALLEEVVVAMGVIETTFNVSRLRYGKERAANLHFKDDKRKSRPLSVERLLALTARSEANIKYLRGVRYIEVFSPSPILQLFDLIDTPGLESIYEEDSQLSQEFIGLYGKELAETTRTEATNVDAVLYLFTKGVAKTDEAALIEFQRDGLSHLKPFNTVGVLTMSDVYECDDPLQKGQDIAQRLAQDPGISKRFYALYAISGLLALGAKTLTQSEFEILKRLASCKPDDFYCLIKDAGQFREAVVKGIPVAPQEREKVLRRLGRYGVQLAYTLMCDGVREQRSLANALFDRSGVPHLRHLILSHFGSRTAAIKLYDILGQIEVAILQERQHATGEVRKIVEEIADKFAQFKRKNIVFHDIQVLSSYYEGKLSLSKDEVQQLLEVTGENGMTFGARLGLPENALLRQMVTVAGSV